MKTSVKMLSAFLMALSISGCGQKAVVQLVPQRCITPTPQKPSIENAICADSLESAKLCLRNYLKMKAYAAKLEEANKVCQ